MVGLASEWVLKNVFRRPAANFPGKVGLYVDPCFIEGLAQKMGGESVVVVGTNGKTTVTNMLADAFEVAGSGVACNRTGANLDSGVATALLHAHGAKWALLECDELWLAKVLPQLMPRYVLLLNLFRDQLDRMGEIDHVQQSIARALAASPETTLVYNCDDPFCQAVANMVENTCVPFGMGGSLGLPQNKVRDSGVCQVCDGLLEYRWRQYGQLGAYRCPTCGFAREEPAVVGECVVLSPEGVALVAHAAGFDVRLSSQLVGAYMAYNLLAVCALAWCCGLPAEALQAAVRAFSPDNGRLQRYDIDGVAVLLNLAKNPTGFNQNLRIVEADGGPAVVGFFINDNEADGHDVSWLWDVDFQELAGRPDVAVFAGGLRRCDMQVRLKYAGIEAEFVDGAADLVERARQLDRGASVYVVANYTALPDAKEQLDRMARAVRTTAEGAAHTGKRNNGAADVPALPRAVAMEGASGGGVGADADAGAFESDSSRSLSECSGEIVIAHLYPELLNLYGDGGNVAVLERRARMRGFGVRTVCVECGDELDLSHVDIAFLGGGPDREQRLASLELLRRADELRAYVESDGVLLAICGGYQILGREWLLDGESVAGLGILDITTGRAAGGSHDRLVGNIALESPIATMPVIGYENHAGRTRLGRRVEPLGRVIGSCGYGNDGVSGEDGAIYRSVVGTYLHGPLLAKNPEIADWLLERALARRAARVGAKPVSLKPIDDSQERAANAVMCVRLGVGHPRGAA